MSWQALEAIVRDGQSALAMPGLAEQVRRVQEAATPEERTRALATVADTIMATGDSTPWIVYLAAAENPVARHLAVLLAGRSIGSLPEEAMAAIRPLLRDRAIPEDAILAATLGLLRTTGLKGLPTRAVLRALVAGRGKARALARLRQLEQRLGSFPSLRRLRSRVERRVPLRCPRCRVKLRRPAMVHHLWDEHRLLLHDHRVREPWGLIEDWVAEHGRTGDRAALDRAIQLAQQMEPERGLFRVQRMLLAHGIENSEARRELLAEAQRQHASLCPRCFAPVAVRHEGLPQPLNVWHGRLTAPGYRVEVSEVGMAPRLKIDTPGGVVYRGREPGRGLTRKGAVILLAGPPVLLALLLAVLFNVWDRPVMLPVLATLLAGLLAWLLVGTWWRPQTHPLDRAITHAWQLLVPRLAAKEPSQEDAAFLGALALTSIGHGRPNERRSSLEGLLKQTEKSVMARRVSPGNLAALWRLAVEDAASLGRDPVPLVVQQAGQSLGGPLPLAFAEQLLRDWESGCWTTGNLARLRVLLCERAFEAGLEVADLVELGRIAPGLGAALGTSEPEQLARLRLLWSLRPLRPWDRCGKASTAFELAGYLTLGGEHLAACPDLLFFQNVPSEDWQTGPWPPILICGRGIVFQETVFTQPPTSMDVRAKRLYRGGGYELLVGQQRFAFRHDPEPILRRLENWFYYYFRDFVPQVGAVHGWRSPGAADRLRAKEVSTCSECHQSFLPCLGEIGLAVDVAP
ncbi:MAG TPA: hypothetical protein VKI65_11585 [Gemmataceae bacterium]|nr:hypothetical protein [Gemmataceae bacterium]